MCELLIQCLHLLSKKGDHQLSFRDVHDTSGDVNNQLGLTEDLISCRVVNYQQHNAANSPSSSLISRSLMSMMTTSSMSLVSCDSPSVGTGDSCREGRLGRRRPGGDDNI